MIVYYITTLKCLFAIQIRDVIITANNMWDEISKLSEYRKQEDRIKREKKTLCRPLLTDMELLPLLYRLFNEYNDGCKNPMRTGSPKYNNLFASVALYFYSPRSLASYKIPNYLRNEIAAILKWYPTSISHMKNSVLFLYRNDVTFRPELDRVIGYITKHLEGHVGS